MRFGAICALVLAILFTADASRANVCVARPLKVSGTLKGIVQDTTGERIPKAQFHVIDDSGRRVGEIDADGNGRFKFNFSHLRNGKYTIQMTAPLGFNAYIGQVKIGPSRFPFWDRGLIFEAGVGSCSGGLARKKLL